MRKVDIAAAEKLVEKEEGGLMRARHAEVLKSITDLNALAGGAGEAAERVEILRLASERDTSMAKVGGPALRALYERASAVVTDASWPDPQQCPVCDTKLSKSISEHLRERIAQYAAADDANTKLETAIDAATCIVRLGTLETAAAMGVPAADKTHGSITQAAHNQILPTVELNTAFARLDALEANRAKIKQGLETERANIEKKLPPSLVAVSKTLASVKQFCEALGAHEKAAAPSRLPAKTWPFVNAGRTS